MADNEWVAVTGTATRVPEKKECEGKDCLNTFDAIWPGQRRCPRCRKEKRPYKDADSPF